MNEINPYKAPESAIDQVVADAGHNPETIAQGQKLIIYAILLNIVAGGIGLKMALLSTLVGLGAAVMSIFGIVRLAHGLGYSTGKKIALIVLMFIPLVNLITLLILNSWATASLREAGYKVGLLGASKP